MLLRQLPPDSACAWIGRGNRPPWSIEAHLLDDLRIALQGKKGRPNPSRPKPRPPVLTPERRKRLMDARRRAGQRRRDIAAKRIT